MPPANPYQTYRKASVQTSDPIKLVVMLYEGAIRNLRQAIGHHEGGRRAEASDRINKTLDIINYLHNCLDFEKGGEISQNLARLYDYARDTLNEANIHLDVEKIQTAIELLTTLLDGWRGVVNETQSDAETQTGEAPARASLSAMG